MLHGLRMFLTLVFAISPLAPSQEMHVHRAPEKLGEVSFPVSCKPAVQQEFDRGVALLHSFAYAAAEEAFRSVADHDPQCAMAHWGIAMTYFHQLWGPPSLPASISSAQREIEQGLRIEASTEGEREFIHAAGLIFQDAEAQVFYGLALLANLSPTDKTHSKQK